MKTTITIDPIPVNKTLYYSGYYTKDLGNDDEYRPEDFEFLLSVKVNEEDEDLENLNVIWSNKKPYVDKTEKLNIETRIINYYYTHTLP